MGVTVGVCPDDPINDFWQHGHWPDLLPWARSTSALAWVRSPKRQICDGSRSRGQASNQANWWARPVPATPRTSRAQGTPKRPDRLGVTLGHRRRAWWSSTQEHRNDTHRSSWSLLALPAKHVTWRVG